MLYNSDAPTVGQGQTEPENELAGKNTAEEILKQRLRSDGLPAPTVEAGLWPWHGYLGSGKVTLLTSQWKSGKSTLVSLLLARMGAGGTVGGLKVAPGSAAVFSEESPSDWEVRVRKLKIGT